MNTKNIFRFIGFFLFLTAIIFLPSLSHSEGLAEVMPIEVILKCFPQIELPASTVDLNGDKKCDQQDIEIFRSLMGKCNKSYQSFAFEPSLDVDCDGCLTEKDLQIFSVSCEKAAPLTEAEAVKDK